MLVAVKIKDKNIQIYHWASGSCAEIDSEGWAGWSTLAASCHPAQSENEFMHKCIRGPGNFFIRANDTGILIKEDGKTILEESI